MTEQPTRRIVVTIDGPAGAGKSSVAKLLARRLGYRLLDTGAIYRAVALAAHRGGVPWTEPARLGEVARTLDIRFDFVGDRNHVYLGGGAGAGAAEDAPYLGPGAGAAEDGAPYLGPGAGAAEDGAPAEPAEDVTAAIRAPEISQGASQVSAHPAVRAALLELQRRLGAGGGVVVEGRDTGTVVFPAAEAKFFLTASEEERTRRRVAELAQAGQAVDPAATRQQIRERDQRDASRDVAPMVPAADAIVVDSSGQTLEQVVDFLAAEVSARARR
ncbi:MAG TPA: (d)CMP kinase [Kofleriaceae bacterium]|nr:(d)CMP kinase [Kofleriaceae bacterium]